MVGEVPLDIGGSLELDINALYLSSKNISNFSSRVASFRIGSDKSPVPISLELMDISDTLLPEYWTHAMSYSSFRIADKRVNLAKALRDYADYVGVTDLTGS